ncbi:39S ribosomal protein L32, mitochondrial isoform X2 [Cephus cinctus]|nr:39S ribosomal protein L32, mitochondrial isoform X2 [Cephus cinctus]
MAAHIINRLGIALQKLDHAINLLFGRGFPPEALCALPISGSSNLVQLSHKPGELSIKDILGDGFLWAVPKSRRTVEKRLKRKFGVPKYNWKPLVPKTNILMCTNCGHNYEAGNLCGYCYARVKQETNNLQKIIRSQLKLKPVEQEVVVLYEGEKEKKSAEFWKNQRVVEVPKKRPQWFHQNLMQPTTQNASDSKEVKPTELA